MRRRTRSVRLAAVSLLATTLVAGLLAPAAPVRALPNTSAPVVQLLGVVPTSPFAGGRVSVLDNEGSAFVRRDRALWIVDDDGELLIEMNVRTGKVKRTFDRDELAAVHRKKRGKGGGKKAGEHRINDLEAVAYDRRKDQLFVFSGMCCSPAEKPTVFRLKRRHGKLRLDSYLPLPKGSDFTAAAWNPKKRRVYVGVGSTIWPYRYKRHGVGSPRTVPGLSDITGMSFTGNGKGLLVAHSPSFVSLVDWRSRTLVPGWTLDLAGFGMADVRAVELVRGRIWASDGYDLRTPGDPLDHGLFVFSIS
jgi:hypothetical protein